MSTKPRVSIITIFLNAEQFISEALDSVLAQVYKDWELILVDDGSADGSTRSALQYAQLHPERIRYREHAGHQNRGMSASRNLGIREATGEYIAFLDADDVYLPHKLAEQVAILDREPAAAMVYGATQHWHSWTGRPEDQCRDVPRRLGVRPDTLVQPPSLIPLFLRLKAQTPGTCGVLVRRDAIDRVGRFNEDFRGMYEDQVFFFKLCLAYPVFAASGTFDRYRQHPGSHSRKMRAIGAWSATGRSRSASRVFLTWLRDYLIEQRVTDREVWKAFDRAFRPYRHPHLYQLSSLARRKWQLPRIQRVLRQSKVALRAANPMKRTTSQPK